MKKLITIIIIILLIALPISIFIWRSLDRIRQQNAPNMETQDFFEVNNLNDGNIHIIFGDEILELQNFPLLDNNNLYLPLDFIQEYSDLPIFWDEPLQILTITTPTRVMRMFPNDLNYYLNLRPEILDLPILIRNNMVYVPMDLLNELSDFNINIRFLSENNIIIADYQDTSIAGGTAIGGGVVRLEPNHKSYIAENLEPSTAFIAFYGSGFGEEENYARIRTESGVLGYILMSEFTEGVSTTHNLMAYNPLPQLREHRPIDGPVNMVWDLITTIEANANEARRVPHQGLNVLSPTWFDFDVFSLNGDMHSRASLAYVNWAHSQGYQVWAMVADNYDDRNLIDQGKTISGAILSDTNMREHVITQLLNFAEEFNLDGLNIDFERVWMIDIDYFHQFLRELYPLMRERGLWLSVDVFVPAPWSMYYNRGLIAELSDFIVVMAYDDYLGTGLIGPNASRVFVENAIINMLNEVPAEKLVLALPFYSRIWIENTVTGEFTQRTVGMLYGHTIFTRNNAEFIWLEDLGCYFAEYEEIVNGELLIHRIWLEDLRSMEEKLRLFERYELAGVAFWRRGLEDPRVWALIHEYISR
ncbi:MAG: glycosyl hydrolase family 18 protein [Defluviitaleaceae bacterium]|nr:glycosyl hydrolase family 18 protein [Defluviitaleaceae bacterium]